MSLHSDLISEEQQILKEKNVLQMSTCHHQLELDSCRRNIAIHSFRGLNCLPYKILENYIFWNIYIWTNGFIIKMDRWEKFSRFKFQGGFMWQFTFWLTKPVDSAVMWNWEKYFDTQSVFHFLFRYMFWSRNDFQVWFMESYPM